MVLKTTQSRSLEQRTDFSFRHRPSSCRRDRDLGNPVQIQHHAIAHHRSIYDPGSSSSGARTCRQQNVATAREIAKSDVIAIRLEKIGEHHQHATSPSALGDRLHALLEPAHHRFQIDWNWLAISRVRLRPRIEFVRLTPPPSKPNRPTRCWFTRPRSSDIASRLQNPSLVGPHPSPWTGSYRSRWRGRDPPPP